MQLTRSAVGALGLFVAAMALASLAARGPQRDPPEAAPPPLARPTSTAALAALRDGIPIELNGALAADLELLPGIGPQLAARIVAHREQHGRFRSVDDLTQVRGIGPRTLERLRPLLAVTAPASAKPTSPAAR